MSISKKLAFVFLLVLLTGCSALSYSPEQTLYQRLGGEQGVERLVDVFIRKIAKDEQVFPYFAQSNVTHFREGFISHFCDVTDGPCEYDGDSMVDIHTGMNINEADFNRIVELLVSSMEELDISYPVQNQVLSRLAPMRGEVIHL